MSRKLTDHEMDCVARAFGFNSLIHMQQVFADSDKRRAEDRPAKQARYEAAAREHKEEQARQAEREAEWRAAEKAKQAQRSANHRAARLAVLARKKTEQAVTAS